MYPAQVKKRRVFITLKQISLFIFTAILSLLLLPMTSANAREVLEFEDLALVVVYSDTDEDAQIIVHGGSEEGIRKVIIFGPKGCVRLRANFRDKGRLGQADFQFDTPEPSIEDLMKAYPPGRYVFIGKSVNGDTLKGKVWLSYQLLPPPEIIYPKDGDTGIPINDLVVLFEPPDGTEAIRFEIEDEEEEVAIKVDLPGDATEFEMPNNWLQPGVEYTLDIKVIGENGNMTVRDVRFITEE